MLRELQTAVVPVAASSLTAIVEFVARYRLAGRAERLHEVSRFVRDGGRWYYVDGDFPVSGRGIPAQPGGAS